MRQVPFALVPTLTEHQVRGRRPCARETRTMADTLFTPTEVTADLKHLEKLFKQISTEWELFLNQTVKWPPHQRKAEIEAIIRHYTKSPPRRTSDRFHFNTLVHRYRTNSERWSRRLRLLEEQGGGRPWAQRRASRRKEKDDVEDLNKPHTLTVTRTPGGRASTEQLRDLYLAYRGAKKARGQTVSKLAYRNFAEKMESQLARVREKAGGRDLELRVDELGGKVRVTVRPARKGDR